MKKVLLSLALVCLVLLALSWTANAADPVVPAVTAVEPSSAFNDIDTRVTITGGDFAAGVDGTVTVSLGATPLTDVTRVDTQTLTATVPWGMDPGVYALTVTNPGGGTASVPGAFEVRQGIGQWNPGTLNGASVRQLLMKPGDPNTLYALASDVGLFRSRDAGEHWTFTSGNVTGNADFVLDPSNPSWLYSSMNMGLEVSKDEGDTWTMLYDTSQDPTPRTAQVFVSPHDPDVIFFATYRGADSVIGLQKSTDAGLHWAAVPGMNGTEVQSLAFDPTPGSPNMTLATADARVFKSTDTGGHWSETTKPPLRTLGLQGYVTYNPYRPAEVWITSTETDGGMYKSADAGLTSWTDVTPWGHSGYAVTFASADSVYIWHARSRNGGLDWEDYGPWPWPWSGGGAVVFSPGGTNTAYICDAMYGVRKTTDGGTTWDIKNQGLTGMRCVSMQVSSTDPLRVYAAFDGWPGVYRSDNGTADWTYFPIGDVGQVQQVCEDPFDPGRLYASADRVYVSATQGETWTALGTPPGSEAGMLNVLAADPHQPGHLLLGCRIGVSSLHDNDVGLLFSTSDWGATWQPVSVITPVDALDFVSGITFDPETPGTIYVTTGGTGVYRSVDNGATWDRIDDVSQPFMRSCYSIAIATHPQHVLLVSGDSGRPFRSFDNGATWVNKENSGEVSANIFRFIDGDSTRLYAPDWGGLHFSSNVGDSWTTATGILGHIQVTQLSYTEVDGHTVLYAATTGGEAGASSAVSATSRLTAAVAAPSTLVGAGIYRRAQVETSRTFYSSGTQDGWVLESREKSNVGGTVSAGSTTLRLGDNAAKKQYRSVLSFGTGATLPDSAVITKVTLKFKKQGVAGGGDPVAKFQGFVLDIKRGLFGTSSLRAGDFKAAASTSFGPVRPAPVSGWYSVDLSRANAFINKGSASSGRTQVRLRFKLDDNNNAVANYLSLYSGNASTASRPQLIVTYYVP